MIGEYDASLAHGRDKEILEEFKRHHENAAYWTEHWESMVPVYAVFKGRSLRRAASSLRSMTALGRGDLLKGLKAVQQLGAQEKAETQGGGDSVNKEPFASWAKLELMGHLRFTGYVEEVEVVGITMVSCIPLDAEGKEGPRRYFGPASIYSLSPMTEEEARAIITDRQERTARRLALTAARQAPQIEEEPADEDLAGPDEWDGDEEAE